MRKRNVYVAAVVVTLLGCIQLFADQPVVNIGTRHGQLRAAQEAIVQAYNRITNAQNNNDYQLGGHAARAKQYLEQADQELRLAADAANNR